MASRQDQVQSYQFMVQRVVAALVTRQTDPAQSPFRRVAGLTLAGLLLAALSLAAVGVYGVLKPGGGTGWREAGAIIIDRESGARYVYLDGRLHPVLNYASALLIVGGNDAHTVAVASRTIAGVPRGVPLGIPGAPDSLPSAGSLLGLPWTVCSARMRDTAATESVLYVGRPRTGGQPLTDAGLLARTPDGRLALIWRQHRYPIPDPVVVRAAFGWANEVPVAIAPALANVLAQGPDLAPPAIPGTLGAPSKVAHRTVGTVVVVATQSGARQYAVVLRDGLAPISQVQADLLLSDPDEVEGLGQRRAEPMSQGDFALAPVAGLPAGAVALPSSTPALLRPSTVDGAVCARFGEVGADASVAVDVPVADAADAARTGTGAAVDRILVPPGRGALVRAMASPGATGGALAVVTDLGVRYPVPGVDVLGMLGYGGATPAPVPANLVALLPAGRALDPAAARTPASVTD